MMRKGRDECCSMCRAREEKEKLGSVLECGDPTPICDLSAGRVAAATAPSGEALLLQAGHSGRASLTLQQQGTAEPFPGQTHTDP